MNSKNQPFSEPEQEIPPKAGRPRWIWTVGGALLFVLAVFGLLFNVVELPGPNELPGTTRVSAQGTAPIVVSTDGYVGSQKCQSCHQHEHATWHDSYHRTMTQLPSSTSIVGDFDGVELETHGRKYRLGRDGETAWIEGEWPDSSGTVRRNVVLCTGSHHRQVYWMTTTRGSVLDPFEFTWLIPEQKWIPRDSGFVRPDKEAQVIETGRWNKTCIVCHTTHGARHPDPAELDQSTVAEFGISCEACHGPGEIHVQHHTKPNRSYSKSDDPIKNPLNLSHVRTSEVCGRCHMKWHYEEPDSVMTFRPGDDLQKIRTVDKTSLSYGSFWPDGMVRVAGREFSGLIESPCFQRGTMSCLSCHTMHQAEDDPRSREEWKDDLLKPQMRGNEACLNCHEEYRAEADLVAHTHHPASTEGSRCYNCHMPHTAMGLLKGVRNHQVSNPSVGEFLSTGRPNACNLCHLDKSLGWTDEAMVDWYGHESGQGSDDWPDVALSIYVALKGDASQRALIAWHMGWDPATQVSNEDWLAPYLAILMHDDYPAVRFIAERSLSYLEGFDDISYDTEMPASMRERVVQEIADRWQEKRAILDRPSLLIAPDGSLRWQRVQQLLGQRNNRDIYMEE